VGGADEDANELREKAWGVLSGSCSCHPAFSEGYEVRLLDPAAGDDCGSSTHCRASRASFGTPMYFDSRFDRSILAPGAPVESASHQRLAGRPRESSSSRASLTLMLKIGDSDGM
jgi:hypothetical protein